MPAEGPDRLAFELHAILLGAHAKFARAPGPEDNDISPRRTEAGDRAGKALPARLVRQRDAIAARRQRSPTPTAMVFAGLRRLSPRQIK